MDIDHSKGFVAVPRGLTDWEWYTDANTARVYLHLLLTANWKDKRWQGINVKAGQLVTSQAHLAEQLGLSVQEVRTALKHLILTDWITVKTGHKYSIITLNYYDSIIWDNRVSNRQITGSQQTANNNLTMNTMKTRLESSAAEPPPLDPTTTALRMEFETSIGKLGVTGQKQLSHYAERLGADLVSEIIRKCAETGGHSWAYVRKALAEAEAQDCQSVEEYRLTNPIGGSRSKRVDRPAPSGNDFLKNAVHRRPLGKGSRNAKRQEERVDLTTKNGGTC